jgi:hypothetical protein
MSCMSFIPQFEALEVRKLLSANPTVIDASTLLKQMKQDLNSQLSSLPGLTKSTLAALDTVFVDFVDQNHFLQANSMMDALPPSRLKELDTEIKTWVDGLQLRNPLALQDEMTMLQTKLSTAQGMQTPQLSVTEQALSSGLDVVEYFISLEIGPGGGNHTSQGLNVASGQGKTQKPWGNSQVC